MRRILLTCAPALPVWPPLRPSAQAPFDPRGVDPASPNPLAGLPLFVDHDSPAWEAWRKYERRGQRGKAALAWKIAREPRSLWFGKFTRPNFHFKVRRRIDAAKAAGQVPVFTLLRAEATKCSPTYQAGGPRGRPRHAQVVRRDGARHRERPRDHRVRARLAGHDRLPGAQPP